MCACQNILDLFAERPQVLVVKTSDSDKPRCARIAGLSRRAAMLYRCRLRQPKLLPRTAINPLRHTIHIHRMGPVVIADLEGYWLRECSIRPRPHGRTCCRPHWLKENNCLWKFFHPPSSRRRCRRPWPWPRQRRRCSPSIRRF